MNPTRAPQAWEQPSYRACEICTSGKTGACKNPNVAGRTPGGVQFPEARRLGGACGPEAAFLDFPGLNGR